MHDELTGCAGSVNMENNALKPGIGRFYDRPKRKEDGRKMTTVDVQCFHCKHFGEEINRNKLYACDAFPDGIPLPIMMNYFVHDKPYSDLGIQFEEK